MQVTLPLGGGVVERDIPQRIPGLAVGEALPDGERLVIDVTENGSPVEAWLRLGDRATGTRLYEETNATGDFTLTDAELDAVCPPGSSVGYEVWTQVGTAAERIRYQGVVRRARSLANANPALTAPTITAPTVTLQSQTALAATFLVDWKAPGGGTVETRTRTVSDGETTVTMAGDGMVTFDKAAASRTVTATDSVIGPAGSNSAQGTATIPALAAAPALASPQIVSLEGGQTPATYDLAQHLTGGIAPLTWETVENDSAGKVTRSGSVLTITQNDYSATVQARVTDAAERSAEITVQITVSEAVVIVTITWDPQPSLDPLTEGDDLAAAVNDGEPSHTSGAPTIIATIINPDHETAVAGQAYTVRQVAEAPDGTLGSATSAAVTAVAAFEFLTQPSIGPIDLREGDVGTLSLGSVDAGTLSIESLTDLNDGEAVGYDDGGDPAEFDATATTYRLTVRAQDGNAVSFATVEKTAEPYGFRSNQVFIVDDGTVTFDYTGSASYSEDAAVVATADLVAGPVNTIPPHVAGTMGNGNVFSVDVIGAWVGLDSDRDTVETYVWSGAGTGTGSSVSIADDTLELVLTARGTNDAGWREVAVTIPARAQFIEAPSITPSGGDEGTNFVITPGEGPASGSLTFGVTDDGADVTEDLTDNGNGTWTYAAPLGTVDRALVVTSTVDTGDGSPAEQTASATIYEAGTTPEWDVEVDASGNITVNERAAVQTRPLTFTVNQAGDINITGVG